MNPLARFGLLFSLLSLLGLLAACQDKVEAPPKPPAPILQGQQLRFTPNHPQLALIGLSTATEAQAVMVELPARLVWNEERTQRIYPAFAGRVSAIKADVGQPVSPGTVLAQLASPDFGAAQADTAKARVDARLSSQALLRQRELFDAGIVARKELDQAEADAARSQAEVQRAEARTRLYGSREPGHSGVNQDLAIAAGIKGLVVERNLNPGQELRPDQSGTGVPPLFVLTDPTSLWVQIDAREAEAGTLKPGASFELVIPSLPGEKFQGRVMAASDFIDPGTRTIKIRGVVANPARLLKAEMLGTARVKRQLPGGVLVPAQAVALSGNKHSVLVQVQPGLFEVRTVALSYEGPREAVISAGLKSGEQVVSETMLLLTRQFRMAQEDSAPSAAAAAPASSGATEAPARAADKPAANAPEKAASR